MAVHRRANAMTNAGRASAESQYQVLARWVCDLQAWVLSGILETSKRTGPGFRGMWAAAPET